MVQINGKNRLLIKPEQLDHAPNTDLYVRVRRLGMRWVAVVRVPGRSPQLVQEQGEVVKYNSELDAWKGGINVLCEILADRTLGFFTGPAASSKFRAQQHFRQATVRRG